MSAKQGPHIAELLSSALEIPATERRAFLDRACGGDPGLRSELDSLIEWHERAESGEWDRLSSSVPQAGSLAPILRACSLDSGRIGAYSVESVLGDGATGIVYRAVDRRNGCTVALKVASPHTLLDPAGRARFARASALSKDLDHPHIVRVLDTGEVDGVIYLAMEFVDGPTLAGLGPDLATALRLGRECAEALAAAHAKGIIHRDLKPANIMVGGTGAKVLDFGLCHASAISSAAQTQTGAILGTAGYMAPEQAGGQAATPQSDLFSWGAVMYEILAGRPAFRGDTVLATLSAVLHQQPPRPEGVPAPILRLIERCLEKDPARRPSSAGEVADEVAELERSLSQGRLRVRPRWDRLVFKTSRLRPSGIALAAFTAAIIAGGAALYRAYPPTRVPTVQRITFDETGFNTEPAISPDRKWIAYASDRSGEGNLDLWIVPISGGSLRRLTRHEIAVRQPEFSPDGATVIYRSDRDGGGIYAVRARPGGQPGPGWLVARSGLRPRFSPDGKWLLFWTGLETSGDLLSPGAARMFVASARGGEPRPVCPGFASALYPIWSPDGKHILFTGRRYASDSSANPALWITPWDACVPLAVGTAADFIVGNVETPIIGERWLPGGRVLYRTSDSMVTGLLEATFSLSTGALREPPTRLSLPVNEINVPSVMDESSIAFAESRRSASLWAAPLDSATGQAGDAARLLECASSLCIPALSADGSVLFYSRYENKAWEFNRRELAGGPETIVQPPGHFSPWPFLAGQKADPVYSRVEDGLYSALRGQGQRLQVLCRHCEELWDVSPDGRYLLAMAGNRLRTVALIDTAALVDTATRGVSELLQHPQWNLYRASFSPDGRSILFTAKLAPERSQILVAEFHGGRCSPTSAWVAVSGQGEYNGPAHWSPGGDRIYFASQADGHRCLYMREWDSRHHTPAGPVVPVRHFHSDAESLSLIPQSLFGFAVARDKIVFPMGRQSGDIWMMR